MKLRNLIVNTPRAYKSLHGISISKRSSKVKMYYIGSYDHLGLRTKAYKTGSTGPNYITQIGFQNPELEENSHAIVHCTCPYFRYWLEVVMTNKRASFMFGAIPQWPVIRNPSGLIYMCKHLFALYPRILNIIKKENKTENPAKSKNLKVPKIQKYTPQR